MSGSPAPGDSRIDELAAALDRPARTPRNTYRIQLGASFTFDDLRALTPYLDALGVDTCYLSPCLAAKPGSTHGYDVVDYGRLNAELGDAEAFASLARALQQRDMGLMFDVVPNHMNLDPVHNPRWRDVLTHGQSALSAPWFDIDWQPAQAALRDRVLQPILGDQYGRVLERGELQVQRRDGALVLCYFEHELPIDPRQIPTILGPEATAYLAGTRAGDGEVQPYGDADVQELASILSVLEQLWPHNDADPAHRDARRRHSDNALARLGDLVSRSARVRGIVDSALTRVNGVPGDPASFDALHDLLERQPYRLAYWRSAFDEINYRRFFDIIELGAVRVEDPEVFAGAHELVLRLVGEGLVTAVRVDHPDGLNDPEAYFERLQAAVWRQRAEVLGVDPETLAALEAWRAARVAEDPSHWAARPLYLAVEKILMPGEEFRPGWAIHGGVGYVFLNQLNGLFVERSGLHQIERLWSRMAGQESYAEIAYECRGLIARTSLASEMNMLAHAIERIAAADRRTRDFTLNSLRKVLREVVACFPVYRSYVTARGAAENDRAVIARAIAEARRRSPVMEASIFDFIEGVLTGSPDTGRPSPAFALRFQQITGPVQAKGTEDTAFYRYCPLLAVNEVGSDPANPSLSVEQFHEVNRTRLADWPESMLALATHDTKRSGDARARLLTLTERADDWRRAVSGWMRLNARHKSTVGDAAAPDKADGYHFYQALLAIWPMEADTEPVPVSASGDIRARVSAYMVKAVREAKVRSSWLRPDKVYESAVEAFVDAVLVGAGSTRFLARFVPFARSIARFGAANSLSQLVLQMGAPGVPDVYQGTELWHLHLVDPDNRQPVDFQTRAAWLAALEPHLARVEGRHGDDDVTEIVRDLAAAWPDGRVKLWVLAALLRYRRRHVEPFRSGAYLAMASAPVQAPVASFARWCDPHAVIVVAPHHAARASRDRGWPVGEAWEDAALVIPPALEGRAWRDVLTGRRLETAASEGGREHLPLARVLDPLPVAWLEADGPPLPGA